MIHTINFTRCQKSKYWKNEYRFPFSHLHRLKVCLCKLTIQSLKKKILFQDKFVDNEVPFRNNLIILYHFRYERTRQRWEHTPPRCCWMSVSGGGRLPFTQVTWYWFSLFFYSLSFPPSHSHLVMRISAWISTGPSLLRWVNCRTTRVADEAHENVCVW